MNKYLNIFTFCKIIKGKKKAIICDFQKKNIKYIPMELADVIKLLNTSEYKDVEKLFNSQKYIFDSYVNFLIDEKFAFFSDKKNEFLSIPNYWNSPEIINNAVVEYDFDKYNMTNAIRELNDLGCKFLEIRLLCNENIEYLEKLLNTVEDSVLCSMRILLPFSKELDLSLIRTIITNNKKIEKVIFYQSPHDNYSEDDIIFIKDSYQKIKTENYRSNDVIIDLDYFIEAQNYNPYYNRKVCIDIEGNIKNCLKNKKNFGNINKVSISKVIADTDFKDLWFASPDKIEGIKDSELKYNILISNDLIKKREGLYEILP